jgi:hypothetical protein
VAILRLVGRSATCQVSNIQGRLLMCIVLEKNTSKGSMLCSEARWRSLDFKVDLERMVNETIHNDNKMTKIVYFRRGLLD